jgi:hypothetical protein
MEVPKSFMVLFPGEQERECGDLLYCALHNGDKFLPENLWDCVDVSLECETRLTG